MKRRLSPNKNTNVRRVRSRIMENREFNYQKQSAEEVVNEVGSKRIMQKFCKRCGRVTRHKGINCMRCS